MGVKLTKVYDRITPWIQELTGTTRKLGRQWVALILNAIYKDASSNRYWIKARWVPIGKHGGYHPDISPMNRREMLRSFSPSQPLRKAVGKWNIMPADPVGWTFVDSLPGEKPPTMKIRASSLAIKGPANTDIYYRYLCRMDNRKYNILYRARERVREQFDDKFDNFVKTGLAPKVK